MEQTLQDIFPDWPSDSPRSLAELINAEYEQLGPKEKALRAQAVELVHRFERNPVLTAADARKLLEKHHLPARKNMWCATALDENKERTYQKTDRSSLRLVNSVSKNVPDASRLRERAPLRKNGSYLLVYGGSPAVLSEAGAAEKIAALGREEKIADVLFWEITEKGAAFYSLRTGVGQLGNQIVNFPDEEALKKARGE